MQKYLTFLEQCTSSSETALEMPKFVPRERKHKVRARQRNGKHSKTVEAIDTNTVEILASTASEKELRRQALREELKSQQTVKSNKKQKRLDKYIVRRRCRDYSRYMFPDYFSG